ncbi:MAG: hypothetical protein DRI90_06505 [Deltaproteobacteria bacterium]|nr:MAG: hypothetical protein DRI90_06505 [Deltaproteobacteria bacterium]
MIDLGKTILLPLATTLTLAACGGPTTPPPDAPANGDDDGENNTTATTDTAPDNATSGAPGAALVTARCVECHDAPVPGELSKKELDAKLAADHETVELTAEERQAIIDHLLKQ